MKSDATDLDKSSSKSVVFSPSFVRFFARDIVTGVVTGEGVNVHEHESVRCKPIHTLFGQPACTI